MSPSYAFYYSQNTFVAIVDLPEGEHQYKFYVDGQWTHDPAEVSSYHQTHNSKDSCDIVTQFPCMLVLEVVAAARQISVNPWTNPK